VIFYYIIELNKKQEWKKRAGNSKFKHEGEYLPTTVEKLGAV
jgi:hypothetical protein